MPRLPINYANTIIYVIRSLADPTLIYVGSTTDFINRKRNHKNNCKSAPQKLYIMIRTNGGWDSFSMTEHSKFPCNNSQESKKEEERVRLELQANLNMIRAFITPVQTAEYKKEYYIENKIEILEKQKEYYEEKKVEILEKAKEYYIEKKVEILEKAKKYQKEKKVEIAEYQKEYYQENKVELAEKAKEYYQENKVENLEQRKEYYQENKVEILEKKKEKITCICGCITNKGHYARHCLSQKHIKFNQK